MRPEKKTNVGGGGPGENQKRPNSIYPCLDHITVVTCETPSRPKPQVHSFVIVCFNFVKKWPLLAGESYSIVAMSLREGEGQPWGNTHMLFMAKIF